MTPEDRYQNYRDALAIVTRLMEACVDRKTHANLHDSREKLITAFGSEMIADTARKP